MIDPPSPVPPSVVPEPTIPDPPELYVPSAPPDVPTLPVTPMDIPGFVPEPAPRHFITTTIDKGGWNYGWHKTGGWGWGWHFEAGWDYGLYAVHTDLYYWDLQTDRNHGWFFHKGWELGWYGTGTWEYGWYYDYGGHGADGTNTGWQAYDRYDLSLGDEGPVVWAPAASTPAWFFGDSIDLGGWNYGWFEQGGWGWHLEGGWDYGWYYDYGGQGFGWTVGWESYGWTDGLAGNESYI